MRRYSKLAVLVVFAFTSLVIAPTSHASNEQFYSLNSILYYNNEDPCEVTSSGSSSSSSSSSSSESSSLGKIVDYANREILTDQQVATIEANRPFYEKAAEKVGIPWEMIAVIHKRETGLGRANPGNGQGIYQFVAGNGGPYPAGPVSDEEFQRQTDLAAEFLLSKAGGRAEALKSAEDDAVKYTFFAYNGLASVYKTQALNLGFTQEQAEVGEGSPYVMNKADEKRDPETNPTGWGQIKTDGGGISYPANQDHGAFVLYAALRGNIANSCTDDDTENGLTEEQAKKFMMAYGENKNNFSANNAGGLWGMCNGGGSNCVTFSYFFNNAFTDLPVSEGDGNGDDIVNTLKAKGASTGTEPKVFSTFSLKNGEFGHTGIVLGKKTDGTYIVGHASCSHQGIGKGDGTYNGMGAGFVEIGKADDGNTWLSGVIPYGFAYPKKVDTEKIKQFLNGEAV